MSRSSKSTVSKLRVIVTTGDPDGIGWEVTAKALNRLGPQPGVQFTVMAPLMVPRQHGRTLQIGCKFRRQVVSSLAEALSLPQTPGTLIEVRSEKPAAHWVEEAAQACLKGNYQALVTAPLSKTSIRAAGMKDIGHTEILSRVSGVEDLFMAFVGKKFSVVLATGHQPLAKAVKNINTEVLQQAIHAALKLRRCFNGAKRRRPLALVGLNPHAGEEGLIGHEELRLFKGLISPDVQGPLVPDAAFLPSNWDRYSVYVVPYHDQGLIPFKMVHGFRGGVHLTLNLPFVRTSVDHGTAKELYGLNQAEPGSMLDALTMALRLAKEKPL